jgi:protease I
MKVLIGCLAALAPLTPAASPKRVVIFLNEGFQAQEYEVPRAALEKAGFDVSVAARYPEPVRPGRKFSRHPEVKPDLTFDQVRLDRFDALVFVGGGGAWEDFFPNATVHELLAEAMDRQMTVGLLCAATGLLGTANNLDGRSRPIAAGRKVTGYPQVEGILTKLGGVRYDPGKPGQPHVVESSELFGKTMVEKLGGR